MYHEQHKRAVAALIEAISADPEVQKLLAYSLGRVLLKEAKSIEGALDLDFQQRYVHIGDWLHAAVIANEPWISATDDEGRPKKLLKFGSVDAIVREADKAMARFAAKNRAVAVSTDDESVEWRLGDGWYVSRLLSPVALDRESGEMGHCIGQGSYDTRLAHPDYAYYSLRDPAGKPHVTMEVYLPSKKPLQVQGKQNREPIPEYIDRMLGFMRFAGIVPYQTSAESRWVYDIDLVRHDIENLPDGVTLLGDVVVTRDGIAFPKSMTVRGELLVRRSTNVRMPENLVVCGKYTVQQSQIVEAPKNLEAGANVSVAWSDGDIADRIKLEGHLFLSDSRVGKIPLGLGEGNGLCVSECNATLDFGSVSRLETLSIKRMEMPRMPSGIVVDRLEFREVPLERFTQDITVLEDLDINRTGLAELPANMVVKGSLDISDNPIDALPKGLVVEGVLAISKTMITELPDDLRLGNSLIASQTPLNSIGTLRHIRGSLRINKTEITELPDGLVVEKELDAEGSKLRRLGASTKVGQAMTIAKTDVEELPEDIDLRLGLDASYSSLSRLPEGFVCNGELRIEGSAVAALPRGLTVEGTLNISHTSISEFPPGVTINGDLDAVDNKVMRLAPDTVVAGRVKHPLGTRVFPAREPGRNRNGSAEERSPGF